MPRQSQAVEPLKIAVAGNGRMGQSVVAAVEQMPDCEVLGIWRRETDLDALVSAADVVIDFSLPSGTEKVLESIVTHATPLVCGVSGLQAAQMQQLRMAANAAAIVYDRNMSVGIAVLQRLIASAAPALGNDFSIAIAETHHVHKKDAPSGTALQLAEALEHSRPSPGKSAIAISSERRGEVAGDHAVTFSSEHEALTLSHGVTHRQVFAAGAIRAAKWVATRGNGLYAMRDVLFSGEKKPV